MTLPPTRRASNGTKAEPALLVAHRVAPAGAQRSAAANCGVSVRMVAISDIVIRRTGRPIRSSSAASWESIRGRGAAAPDHPHPRGQALGRQEQGGAACVEARVLADRGPHRGVGQARPRAGRDRREPGPSPAHRCSSAAGCSLLPEGALRGAPPGGAAARPRRTRQGGGGCDRNHFARSRLRRRRGGQTRYIRAGPCRRRSASPTSWPPKRPS